MNSYSVFAIIIAILSISFPVPVENSCGAPIVRYEEQVPAITQLEVSKLQFLLHFNAVPEDIVVGSLNPKELHVFPFRFVPSHCLPFSIFPSPQYPALTQPETSKPHCVLHANVPLLNPKELHVSPFRFVELQNALMPVHPPEGFTSVQLEKHGS